MSPERDDLTREEEVLQLHMAAELAEIERTRMPFGRYGPQHYPPAGIPIYELPAEYLRYFEIKGFPSGRLGKLLRIVYQMKVDGADIAFEPMRKRAGGPVKLRKERKKDFRF